MKTGHLLAIFIAVATAAVAASLLSRQGCRTRQAQTAPQSQAAAPFASGGLPVLTGYGAEWCPWCKKLEKVLDGLAPKYEGALVIRKVDLDKDRSEVEELAKLGFDGSIPFIALRSGTGEVLWSQRGYLPENEIEKALAEHGITKK